MADLGKAAYDMAFKNKNKSVVTSKVLALSDSLLGQGNFVNQLQTNLGATTMLTSIKGGQQVGIGLAEMADEIYVQQVGENALKYSNHLANAVWSKMASMSVTEEVLSDGLLWNKITKADSSANQIIYQQNLAYPAGATGYFFQADVYIPVGSNCTRIGFYMENATTSASPRYYNAGSDLPPGYYRIQYWFDKAGIVWTAGGTDNIKFSIILNNGSTPANAACNCYVRNITVSFKAPTGYQSYVDTGASAVPAGAAAWTLAPRCAYSYRDIDVAILCYGRNDSGYPVDKYAFFKAYDKLVYNCMAYFQNVVPLSPPPIKSGSSDAWDVNDSYLKYYNDYLRYTSKWNAGADVFKYFKDLTNAGSFLPSQLMQADGIHQSNTGGIPMAQLVASELAGRKPTNGFSPVMRNKSRYYLYGTPTGSWTTTLMTNQDFEYRLIGGYSVCMVSSTLNDTLDFGSITCEQLHVIYREDAPLGTFEVIVDEGLPNEIHYPFNAGVFTDRQAGKFVCDFGYSGNHTVKIKVTSTGKSVKIYGIEAI